MKKLFHSIALGVVGLSLAACGGSGQEEETAPAATAAPAPAPAPAAAPEEPAGPPHLKFSEMTVYEGTTAIFKIHADGKTEVAAPPQPGAAAGAQPTWAEGPQVAPDGTITFKQQKVARVEQDGTIKNLRTNAVIPVKVGQDTLTASAQGQEVVLQIKEDGAITVPGAAPDKQLRVEGAADAEARRTAMALLGAIFLSAKVEQQQAQQPAGGAQPAPGGAQPAPGGAQPAPGGAQPAPGGAQPAQPTPPPKPTK